MDFPFGQYLPDSWIAAGRNAFAAQFLKQFRLPLQQKLRFIVASQTVVMCFGLPCMTNAVGNGFGLFFQPFVTDAKADECFAREEYAIIVELWPVSEIYHLVVQKQVVKIVQIIRWE